MANVSRKVQLSNITEQPYASPTEGVKDEQLSPTPESTPQSNEDEENEHSSPTTKSTPQTNDGANVEQATPAPESAPPSPSLTSLKEILESVIHYIDAHKVESYITIYLPTILCMYLSLWMEH